MVLAALGRPMTEAALRALTDCSPLGTDAFKLVEAARQLGFPASQKYTLASLEELAIVLAEGHLPIVYVDMWPLQGGLSGSVSRDGRDRAGARTGDRPRSAIRRAMCPPGGVPGGLVGDAFPHDRDCLVTARPPASVVARVQGIQTCLTNR